MIPVRFRRSRGVGRPLWLIATAAVSACSSTTPVVVDRPPSPPRNLEAFYYGGSVHISWELGAGWDGEPFRIWGRRVSDRDDFFIAEVTSCARGRCVYEDANVTPDVTYIYYVTAVSPSGLETASDESIEVFVPVPIPPPVPGSPDVVPLDGALFVTWDASSRTADDFAFYRVYSPLADGSHLLLGETSSESFLDALVENGSTYGYIITAWDAQGHESEGTALVEGTPRPDYYGELLYAFGDRPERSGFRFPEAETVTAILHGEDPDRDFRIEVDAAGWWLSPAPGVQVAEEALFTTALRCGPAADSGCRDLRRAPGAPYHSDRVRLEAEYTYAIRVPWGAERWRYGAVRVTHLGLAQDGAVAIFDWAFQTQPGNPSLAPAHD